MNRTKDELLLECIKQFEHIENVLGYDKLSTTRSLIDEINQALTIPTVSSPFIMRTRGKLFKKEIWFSICSRHAIYEENCKMCNTGSWQNAIKYKISSLIYKFFPALWRWWVNR